GTRFDPNTPLANARLAERRLGDALLLTHDRYGHTSHADPSRCVTRALGRYLIDITPPARGTVCPSDHLPFDPGFGQPVPDRTRQWPAGRAERVGADRPAGRTADASDAPPPAEHQE